MRFGQVDLNKAKHHVHMIWIVLVSVFGWFDDIVTNIGMRSLKCI